MNELILWNGVQAQIPKRTQIKQQQIALSH